MTEEEIQKMLGEVLSFLLAENILSLGTECASLEEAAEQMTVLFCAEVENLLEEKKQKEG